MDFGRGFGRELLEGERPAVWDRSMDLAVVVGKVVWYCLLVMAVALTGSYLRANAQRYGTAQ